MFFSPVYGKDCNTSSITKDYDSIKEAAKVCYNDPNCDYIKNMACDDENNKKIQPCEKNSTFDVNINDTDRFEKFNTSECLFKIGIFEYINGFDGIFLLK